MEKKPKSQISFDYLLDCACVESKKWLKSNRSKGLRWLIHAILKGGLSKKQWIVTLTNATVWPITNVYFPTRKLRTFYPHLSAVEKACGAIVTLWQIKGNLATEQDVFNILNKYNIDDVFAD